MAIAGEDGWNDTHASVQAGLWDSDDLILTAVSHGTAGNFIDTTESFSAGTNVFDAVTLGTTQAGQEDGLFKATQVHGIKLRIFITPAMMQELLRPWVPVVAILTVHITIPMSVDTARRLPDLQ